MMTRRATSTLLVVLSTLVTHCTAWLTPPPPLHRTSLTPSSRRAPPAHLGPSATTAKWLEELYDSLDYEAIMLAGAGDGGDDDDDDLDDSAEEYTYGESDLEFFLSVLRTALDAADTAAAAGFCDLGGGKGQLALAAARAEPERLRGRCVSLEIVPELHAIAEAATAQAARQDAGYARTAAERGDIFRGDALARSVKGAAVCFCYASKFESQSGTHAERLSAALAASALPSTAVVATVNRKLCEADGWREAAPPLQGPTPQENAQVGTAYFWTRA